MKKKVGVICAMVLALVAFGSLAAVADEAETRDGAEAAERIAPEGTMPVSVAGMTVFIDKETGELRQPSAEEAAALGQAMQRMMEASAGAAAAQEERATETGGVALAVGPEQLNFSVATVAADGTVRFECVDSAHAAEAHVHGQVETPEER